MTYLLDVNVLIALTWPQHVHHERAHEWFTKVGQRSWASCAITQLAFVRISSNPAIIPEAVAPHEACTALDAMTASPNHQYWGETPAVATFAEFRSVALVGHRQVTDAYLVAIARKNAGRLATLDRAIKTLHSGSKSKTVAVELID